MNKYKTPLAIREERQKHILELNKTQTLREIKKTYPKLTSSELGKIVLKHLYEFKRQKNESNSKRKTPIQL